MAKKIGVCPNCKEVIIVNADKKLNICSLCEEPYMTSEAINGDIPSNKKLGVCPSCNKEIIVSTNKKLGICPLCKEPYMTSETYQEEEPAINNISSLDDELSSIAMGLDALNAKEEETQKNYERKINKARSLAIRERFDEALKIYEELIDNDPSDMNGYMGIIRVASLNYTAYEGEEIEDAINVAKQISRNDDIEMYDPDYEQYKEDRENYFFKKNEKIKAEKERQRLLEEKRKKEEAERLEKERLEKIRQEEIARQKAIEEQRKKDEALRLERERQERIRKEKEALDREINAYYANAINGDAYSQYRVGEYYYTGRGVTKSYEEAFSWFEKSAKNGSPAGMERLGDCYYNGHGVSRNFSLANKWYTKAAKLQNK